MSPLARAAALLVLACVSCWPALDGAFLWDDDAYVSQNPALRDGAGLVRIWVEPGATPQYYPLVFTSFWVEWQAFGAWTVPYHLTNLLLHAASGLLVWRLLVRLAPAGLAGEELERLAWAVAAAFVVHPVCVESVAWITERKNVLSLALYLGATAAWQRFSPAASGIGAAPAWRWYAAALGLYVGAMLAKTVTSTWPAAMLVLAWWKRGRLERRELAALAPAFAIGLLFAWTTVTLERDHVGAAGEAWALSPLARLLLAGRIAWFYLGKLLLPVPLAFVYPRWDPDPALPANWAWSPLLLAALAALLLLRARLGRGPLAAALLWLGTLVPALGFFDVYPFLFSWVADHFQYHAMPALLAALVTGAGLALRRLPEQSRRLGPLLLGCWLLSLALLARNHAATFTDREALWRATLAENPDAWLAHNNLGNLLADRGEVAEAAEHYAQAVRLAPGQPSHRLNFAWACSRLGRVREADEQFEAALALEPDAAQVHFTWGEHLERTGRLEQAAARFEQALRLDPGAEVVRLRLERLRREQELRGR